MVGHQVSTIGVNVWDVDPESGGRHAVLLALCSIDGIVLFVSCFVLGQDPFLFQGVGGFELHWNVVFLKDSPKSEGVPCLWILGSP